VDEHGGSIFHFRPLANGAADLAQLVEEVQQLLANGQSPISEPTEVPIQLQ
jgi:hypothetical protein